MLFPEGGGALTRGLLTINTQFIRHRYLLLKMERSENGDGVYMGARVWGISRIQ